MSCSRSYIVLKGRQNLILINILFLLDLDDFLDFFQSEIFKPLNQPINPFLNIHPSLQPQPLTPLFSDQGQSHLCFAHPLSQLLFFRAGEEGWGWTREGGMIVGLLAILKLHLTARGKFMLGSSRLCSCSRSVSLTQTEVE